MRSVVIIILCCQLSFAQKLPSTSNSAPSEENARHLIEKAIAALLTASDAVPGKNFALTGGLIVEGLTGSQNVKVLSRGVDDLHFEITYQDGNTHLVITSSGKGGVIRDVTGKVIKISNRSRTGAEIPFLPLPGILSDVLQSAGGILDRGTEFVNGRAAHHVTVTRRYPKEADPTGHFATRLQIDFFIDSETFLPLKIQHMTGDVTGRLYLKRALLFADYHIVEGTSVPFTIIETLDDQKTWTMSISSIELNPKFEDSDFQF